MYRFVRAWDWSRDTVKSGCATTIKSSIMRNYRSDSPRSELRNHYFNSFVGRGISKGGCCFFPVVASDGCDHVRRSVTFAMGAPPAPACLYSFHWCPPWVVLD